jgi:hypothetical protein
MDLNPTIPTSSTFGISSATALDCVPTPTSGKVPIPKKQLKALLEVDNMIADSTSKSLQVAFSKYKACNAAIQAYDSLISAGDWPVHYERPTFTEI